MTDPWTFGWTQLLTIAGFAITIGIAWTGFRTFERWRREKIEEKCIDPAVEALALAKASSFSRTSEARYVHSEVIKPALALLSEDVFAAANEEFLKAHRHYREGSYKDCVVAANRAFETTLKSICRERGWAFNPGDRASELVTLVRNQALFPSYLARALRHMSRC